MFDTPKGWMCLSCADEIEEQEEADCEENNAD
jgi:hypothetical protein